MASISLRGSERVAMRGALVVAPADPTERLEVTLIVRRQAPLELQARVAALASGQAATAILSREEFAQRHGAQSSDFSEVRAFAAAHGLKVVEEHAARRTVLLSGSVSQFNAAFNVRL